MPTQSRPDVHALAGAYALDAMDHHERADFELHLETCDACRHEVAEFEATAAMLAATAERTPPPALRARILEAASTTRQEAPVVSLATRRGVGSRMLSIAAAVLVVAVGALSVVTFQAQRRADRAEEVATVVSAPDARLVQLEIEAGGATATFVWSARRDAGVLLADGLVAPADQQLALWLIHDEVPVLVGAFEGADDRGPAAVVDGSVAGADVVAVTAEPLGEIEPAPQGPLVASATLV